METFKEAISNNIWRNIVDKMRRDIQRFTLYRTVGKHPTIRCLRGCTYSPILSGNTRVYLRLRIFLPMERGLAES